MAINFPASPTIGQIYSLGARGWTWNGASWDLLRTTNPADPYYTIQQFDQIYGIVDASTSINKTIETDSQIANVKFLLDFEAAFAELSGKTVTASGAVVSSTEKKFGTYSGYFDGVNDYLSMTNTADFQFGAGEFTIEAWIRPAVLTGSDRTVFWYGNDGNYFGSVYLFVKANGAVEAGAWDGSTGDTATTTAGDIVVDTWYHVAVCRGGGTLRIYIDGTEEASVTCTRTISVPVSSPITQIGAYYGASRGQWWNGYIDEMRITKSVARYTANFTTRTLPFPKL